MTKRKEKLAISYYVILIMTWPFAILGTLITLIGYLLMLTIFNFAYYLIMLGVFLVWVSITVSIVYFSVYLSHKIHNFQRNKRT